MREGVLLSGLLHIFVILLLSIGLPDLFRRELEPPPVIPIEVINISDLTQAPALKVKPKNDSPKEEVEKPEPPKPTPVVEKTPEPEKQPDPEPTPEPELSIDDLLAPVVEEKKKEEKPKEKKKKKKKQKKKDFNKLLQNLDKAKSSSEGPTQQEQDENSTADHAANNISETLSVTEMDLVRRQLAACWNVAAGTRDAKDLYVDVKIEMSPDATVRTAAVIGSSGNKAADDSALRAVRNPKCSPLKLPLNRYDQWKTITVRFDPQHIL